MTDRPPERPTERPTRTPAELEELSRQLMVDFVPMASFSKDPFILVEGKGIRVRDTNGRWYIDSKQ